jgi:hypothetical protein
MFLLGIYIVFSNKNFGNYNDFIIFDIKNNTQKHIANASFNSNCDGVLNDIFECYEKSLSIEKNNPNNVGKVFKLKHDQLVKINENCILNFVSKDKIYPKPTI